MKRVNQAKAGGAGTFPPLPPESREARRGYRRFIYRLPSRASLNQTQAGGPIGCEPLIDLGRRERRPEVIPLTQGTAELDQRRPLLGPLDSLRDGLELERVAQPDDGARQRR